MRGALGLAIVAAIAFGAVARAGDRRELVIRKHRFLGGEYEVFEGGRRVGIARRDKFEPDRYDFFDDRGGRERTIRRNRLLGDAFDIGDKSGKRVGTLRKNPLIEGDYLLFDERGRATGRLSRDRILEDRYRFEGE